MREKEKADERGKLRAGIIEQEARGRDGGASESAVESATAFGHQQVTGDLSVIILIK